MVIGCAEIAGYASTGRSLAPARLADHVEPFATGSSLIVTDCDGRVVETVGDEIVIVVDDVAVAADLALALAQRPGESWPMRITSRTGRRSATAPRRRPLRTVVNLVGRLTAQVRPGTVVVDQHLADNRSCAAAALHPSPCEGSPGCTAGFCAPPRAAVASGTAEAAARHPGLRPSRSSASVSTW
jgi:class 3 adenylate cyclase